MYIFLGPVEGFEYLFCFLFVQSFARVDDLYQQIRRLDQGRGLLFGEHRQHFALTLGDPFDTDRDTAIRRSEFEGIG